VLNLEDTMRLIRFMMTNLALFTLVVILAFAYSPDDPNNWELSTTNMTEARNFVQDCKRQGGISTSNIKDRVATLHCKLGRW